MEKIPDLGQMVLMILFLVVMNIILLTTYVNHKYDFFIIQGLFVAEGFYWISHSSFDGLEADGKESDEKSYGRSKNKGVDSDACPISIILEPLIHG